MTIARWRGASAAASSSAPYRWLLEEGIDADRVAFVGDSAGGALALATQLCARDEGLPLPARRCADGVDDADRLVAHAMADLARRHRRVRPQIAAADCGTDDADDRVGRLDNGGIRDVLDADVAGGRT